MQALRGEIFPRHDYGGQDIGTGTQYLMLVGASEPWTLLAPNIFEEQAALTGAARKMLDCRIGVRPCLFSVFARVNGPEALQDEFDVGAWYAQHRLPAMARMPGCIGARTMLSVAGWAKYSVLYEFTSLAARMEHFEQGHESLALDTKQWTGRVVRYTMHAPGSPTVAERIWPPVDETAA